MVFMKEKFTYIEEIESLIDTFPPESILSRNLFQDDSLKIILFGFQPGQELSEHTASVPATLHFLRGTATVVLGKETKSAQKGTWIHLPAHLPHSISAETETLMLLTMHL
jgi:quercetin dioxygenase-like cupin family protein